MYESESEEEHSESEFYYPDDTTSEDLFFTDDNQRSENQPLQNSQEEIESFVSGQKSANTVRKTRSDIKTFERYLTSIRKNKVIESLPASELDHLLCKFFINARRVNNEEYEPDSLSGIQRSIQRFLVDQKSQSNILKDVEFSKSRQVLAAKRKELVNKGKGNKPNAAMSLTDEEENKLFDSGQFGEDSPETLQRALWWFLAMHFGFRARDESRKMKWGDVILQQDATDGREMLVWLSERGTKTRKGQEKSHQRQFRPKIYATGTDRCPIKYYKLFLSHRPAEMNQPKTPFFSQSTTNGDLKIQFGT